MYTTHGYMTAADWAEYRADYDLDCADGICPDTCCPKGEDVEEEETED